MRIKVAFDVPFFHFAELADLSDFHVARYEPAITVPKYREKITPVGLAICPPLDVQELRRATALIQPDYVTVHPPTNPAEAAAWLARYGAALDCEIAIVIPPPGSSDLYGIADEDDVVYLPRWDDRVLWLLDQPVRPWVHFEELAGAEELKDILDLGLPAASLHTAKPVKMAFYDCDWQAADRFPDLDPGQRLTPEQVRRAREIMEAVREVTR